MARLLIATTNRGKLEEVRHQLQHRDVPVLSLEDFPPLAAPEESGTTFAENARLKALYYAAATGVLTLADDSGLEVEALDGAPGVHSARYAGERATDAQNNRKLLDELDARPGSARAARFVCAMALAFGDTVVAESAGEVHGTIIDSPRGHNGFGYDPLFLIEARRCTAAELPREEKSRISHRGRALRAILPAVEKALDSSEIRR